MFNRELVCSFLFIENIYSFLNQLGDAQNLEINIGHLTIQDQNEEDQITSDREKKLWDKNLIGLPQIGRGIHDTVKTETKNFLKEIKTLEEKIKRNNENFGNSDTEFEERRYPATMFACTTTEPEHGDPSMENKYREMFQKLYNYLQGDNMENMVMEMTVPVFTFRYANRDTSMDKISMCFWMNQHNKPVPDPNPESDVIIWNMMETNFYVRRFSAPQGFGYWDVWESQLKKLTQGVEGEGLEDNVDLSLSVMTSYNHPWTNKNRRDEVMLRKLSYDQHTWVGPWRNRKKSGKSWNTRDQ